MVTWLHGYTCYIIPSSRNNVYVCFFLCPQWFLFVPVYSLQLIYVLATNPSFHAIQIDSQYLSVLILEKEYLLFSDLSLLSKFKSQNNRKSNFWDSCDGLPFCFNVFLLGQLKFTEKRTYLPVVRHVAMAGTLRIHVFIRKREGFPASYIPSTGQQIQTKSKSKWWYKMIQNMGSKTNIAFLLRCSCKTAVHIATVIVELSYIECADAFGRDFEHLSSNARLDMKITSELK